MIKDIVVAIIGGISTIVAAYLGNKLRGESERAVPVPAGPGGQAPTASFLRRPWYLRPLTFIVAGLVVMLLVVGFIFGQVEQQRQEELQRAATANALAASYTRLITKGLGKKPYVMPSVLMLVTLELSADGKSITSDRRNFYFIQALQDVKSKDGTFKEEYHSHWPIEQIAGADKESITEGFETGKVGYNVEFGFLKGERHTTLTGAHVTMPFDLPTPRPRVHMYADLGSHDDAYCYPNDSDDIIEELVIVVQSTSLKLGLPGYPDKDAGISDSDGNNAEYSEPQVFPALASANRNFSIVARFRDVPAGKVVGVHVSWERLNGGKPSSFPSGRAHNHKPKRS